MRLYLLLYSSSILQIKFLNKLNQLGLENMIKDRVRDCIANYKEEIFSYETAEKQKEM